jgi:hypothetical protein
VARDLMFQAEIKQAVRHAYAAITSGGGEAVAHRLYTEPDNPIRPSRSRGHRGDRQGPYTGVAMPSGAGR